MTLIMDKEVGLARMGPTKSIVYAVGQKMKTLAMESQMIKTWLEVRAAIKDPQRKVAHGKCLSLYEQQQVGNH